MPLPAALLALLALHASTSSAQQSCPNGAGWEAMPLNASLCSPVVALPSISSRPHPAGNLHGSGWTEIKANFWKTTLSGTSYGAGNHYVRTSSNYGTWAADVRIIFDGNSALGSYTGMWADRTYSGLNFTHGGPAGTHLPNQPGYDGEWVVIMLPASVSGLSQVNLFGSTANDYRVYGRNAPDAAWTMLVDVRGALYDNVALNNHVSPAFQVSGTFNTLGFVARSCNGDSLAMRELSFVQGGPTPGSCNPGTFAFNASHCMLCLPGTFSNATGAADGSACDDCPAGSYAYAYGSWKCTPCPAGSHSTTVGSSDPATCKRCPPDTYSPGRGYADCLPCAAPGFFNEAANTKTPDGSGSTECRLVPVL